MKLNKHSPDATPPLGRPTPCAITTINSPTEEGGWVLCRQTGDLKTPSTARTKAHGGSNSGRSRGVVRCPTTSGGARRVGDPERAKETQRLGETVGPGGQDEAAVTSGRGGARVQED